MHFRGSQDRRGPVVKLSSVQQDFYHCNSLTWLPLCVSSLHKDLRLARLRTFQLIFFSHIRCIISSCQHWPSTLISRKELFRSMNKFWIVFTRMVYHYNWYLSLGSVVARRNTRHACPVWKQSWCNITQPTSSFTPCHHRGEFIVQHKNGMPALCWCQLLCAPLLVRSWLRLFAGKSLADVLL